MTETPDAAAAAEPAADLAPSRAALLGLVAGVMAGLFGVGGGIVLVPGLVLVAGFAQHVAHATSLAAIVVTAPAAALPFAAAGEIAWDAAAVLAVGAVGGVAVGTGVMHRLSADRLRLAFAGLMMLVAFRLVLPGGGGGSGRPSLDAAMLIGLALVGVAAGLLSALMGVGGGVVLVPAMVVLFGFGQHLAQGTSLAVILPTALLGAIRHTRNGYTRWRSGLLVGAGGVAGGLLGGQVAQGLDADVLQTAFAVLLVVSAVRLGRRARRSATKL